MMSPSALEDVLAQLNDEQRQAVRSIARITVVPACPGSGKTRLIAARFIWETFHHRESVAAISFTKVAEQEIRGRVYSRAAIPGHPHFVGTIDAFLLRYVVRPFGGDYVNFRRFRAPVDEEEYRFQRDTVYGSEPRYQLRNHHLVYDPAGTAVEVGGELLTDSTRVERVFLAKKAAWRCGEVTHTDVSFIAANLLESERVRGVILGRFPVLLLDEFQDTGGARESCVFSLLRDERLTRSLVVGDPDQCIMEFAGARPALIGEVMDLPGTEVVYLSKTYRFHEGIARVVRPLAKELQELNPVAPEPESRPSTLLLVHDFAYREHDMSAVPRAFERFLVEFGIAESTSPSAILVWKSATLDRLRGSIAQPEFQCTWLSHCLDGLTALRVGRANECFKAMERVLSDACGFAGPSPTLTELARARLERRAWRRFVWRVATTTLPPASEEETVEGWVVRIKTRLAAELEVEGYSADSVGAKIRLRRQALGDALQHTVTQYCSVESSNEGRPMIEKVHQVKGKEFPAVCYFVPKQQRGTVPPSIAWLRQTATEESRVAYVAMTRAKQALLLVISRDWYADLASTTIGSEFIASFGGVADLGTYIEGLQIA